MLEFLDDIYYIDFKEVDKFLVSDKSYEEGETITEEFTKYYGDNNNLINEEITTTKNHKNKEINGVRYDIIRGFINDLGDSDNGETKDAIGRTKIDELGIRFKLAFNTLLFYNILKKLD
jgi:hypothetical protein